MYITGNAITPFNLNVKLGYKPDIKYALDWFQLANGQWTASDRGSTGDIYTSSISTYGTLSYITNIYEQLQSNRKFGHVLNLSQFASDEHIFGEDVDYTTISGTVTDLSERYSNSKNGFGLDIIVKAITPSFSGIASLPDWTTACVSAGYKGNLIYTVNKYDTYQGSMNYYDADDDNGEIEFTLNLTNTQLRGLQAWLRTNRTTSFSLTSLYGVTTPFPHLTLPQTVKIRDVSYGEQFGLTRQIITLRMITC